MIIKKMFENDIDRDIKGVIKVAQSDEENKYQELNEYVVTKELTKHFREFFENYEKSIEYPTDDIGVWISGFFGSGKSHFLKILSYILENKDVKGIKPVNFFKKNSNKIQDSQLIANMEAATKIDTDVLLFNIDSQSAGTGNEKDPILNVFIKVFNKMQGYCGEMSFLAEFEKQLDNEGKYEEFKNEFMKVYGSDWISERSKFYYIQDVIIKTITNIGFMSEDAALNWANNGENNYNISIEDFAKNVNDYCKNKGENHRIVFLVDEMGQYIGDDTRLMLNLQTLTEELGMKCRGKAWIMVTSQQNIDDLMDVKGQDFSKIQGRFKTRLSLSSANVDEVIRKRILAKKEVAKNMLESDYPNQESLIKNLITFKDTAEMKSYTSPIDYAEVYPFIPYQFNLLQSVLTSIREHGASGKHLAEGERSMLSLFQESAQQIENQENKSLVPFNIFYNALGKFVDSSHSNVIIKAKENENLSDFDVELLKTLFMVKYVKEIKATLENITTLLIDNIDVDRIDLKEKIEKSLKRLIQETLIQKNGEVYSFLTNDEQDINRAIKHELVEPGEIINEVSSVVFEDIFKSKKYDYKKRYTFPFNKSVDNKVKGHQNGEMGIRIITSYYELDNSNPNYTRLNNSDQMITVLKNLSEKNNEIIIYLNTDDVYLDEIKESLQIQKFLTRNSTDMKNDLKYAKQEENKEKKERIRLFLDEAIQSADIYINGRKSNISEKNSEERINDALAKLVEKVYNKLSYMENTATEEDIFVAIEDAKQNTFQPLGYTKSHNALNDLEKYVEDRTKIHDNPSLKTILNRFKKAPYGFKELDIEWLVAVLFTQHRINLKINGENIPLNKCKAEEIKKYLTNKKYKDKLLITKKKETSQKQLKIVRNILKDVFNITITAENDETIMDKFIKEVEKDQKRLKELLDEYIFENYPGKETVEKSLELLLDVKGQKSLEQFYTFVVKNEDEFLDLHYKLEPIIMFFEGTQKQIFTKAYKVYKIYSKNRTYLNNDLTEIAQNIKNILDMSSPYSNIKYLPELSKNFEIEFEQILIRTRRPILEKVERDKNSIIESLNTEDLKNRFLEKFTNDFDRLIQKLNNLQNISTINGIDEESNTLYNKCLEKINIVIQPTTENIKSKPKIICDDELKSSSKNQTRLVNVSIRYITPNNLEITSEKDIDKFVEDLRFKLKKELKNNDKIYLRS